jgi:hypothetical protein
VDADADADADVDVGVDVDVDVGVDGVVFLPALGEVSRVGALFLDTGLEEVGAKGIVLEWAVGDRVG